MPASRPASCRAASPFATLAAIARRLADEIGPAAEAEMGRLSSSCTSIDDLCAAAALLIPDEAKRGRFLAEVRPARHATVKRPGLVFTVEPDLTGFHRPPIVLTAVGFTNLVALPRACLIRDGGAPASGRAPGRASPDHALMGAE